MIKAAAARLVLAHHGESEAASVFPFDGCDPPRTGRGGRDAVAIAGRLAAHQLEPDRVLCSILGCCLQTAAVVLATMRRATVPVLFWPAWSDESSGALAEPQTLLDRDSRRDTAAGAGCAERRLPAALRGGTTLVIAHETALRGLAQALDARTSGDLARCQPASGEVLVYDLGGDGLVTGRFVLA